MSKLLDYIRRKFKAHSPSKWGKNFYEEESENWDSILFTPNKSFCFPVDKDKQVVKIYEGKSVVIQFDTTIKPETIKQLKEDIQNQIKENGFAVVDGRCKIVEFDNPKYFIETK